MNSVNDSVYNFVCESVWGFVSGSVVGVYDSANQKMQEYDFTKYY